MRCSLGSGKYTHVYASIAHARDSGRRCCPSRNVFLRSCTDRDFSCHRAVPASNHCKKNDMLQPMLCCHPPPTRKRVLLFRTWSMSLWRRPDFPHETVATSTVLACVCVHTQTFNTSQHIKLSKSINHFKGGHDLLLFFGVWPNMKMRVACLFGCSLEPWV